MNFSWNGLYRLVHERLFGRRLDNMIRECGRHGYFADDNLCPACNDEGKFILRTGERDSLARRLALILRHAPEKFDLEMDINGWVDVKDIIRSFKKQNERRYHWLRPHHFRAVTQTDGKGRYEVRGNMIRATYGHTLDIELDLPTENIPASLFYPCDPKETDNLMEVGITPSGRSHVHLSGSIRTAAEAGHVHHSLPTILEIDTAQMVAAGETIWHAGVTVYLTESVDSEYINKISNDDPEYETARARWVDEEE
ncbi:MAG: RNA 2'-phosphotransferase [Euryarchaeota archaeon]|jgi:putative RNA 2'-phosphotransferase|nr:RNA 2'-phosphotransferase [Euryarchaeota archaeon]MBT3654409.1 RNA 2'-phosphotransferase [Euryarchaeota archaeon]MBT3757537.1 RNA 2'-phosphotransferase [Euryarchaeota archaeon]MBT4050629.1 RNA 2'-phosphotransferase [Euryarchaeota archaeon]MBT4650761.1 RNA 2'-phosphotransferase [Euryarchaeota archaeon]|tara:strand:+ start:1865 stop:2626 length:762 start_codon:yes stop_codon:yes gene_type:complete